MRKFFIFLAFILSFTLISCEDGNQPLVKELNNIFKAEEIDELIKEDLTLKDLITKNFPEFNLNTLEFDNAIVSFSSEKTLLVPVEFYIWQNKENRNLYFSKSFNLGIHKAPEVYHLTKDDVNLNIGPIIDNAIVKTFFKALNLKLVELEDLEQYKKVFHFTNLDFKIKTGELRLKDEKLKEVLSYLSDGFTDILNYDYLEPYLKIKGDKKINEVVLGVTYEGVLREVSISFLYNENEFTKLSLNYLEGINYVKFNLEIEEQKVKNVEINYRKDNSVLNLKYRLNNKAVPPEFMEAEKDSKSMIDLIKENLEKE